MCASVSSASVDGGAKVDKEAHAIGQLVIRVQAARVGQYPDPSRMNSSLLFASDGLGLRENISVGDLKSACQKPHCSKKTLFHKASVLSKKTLDILF